MSTDQLTPSGRKAAVRHQFFATVCGNLMTASYGSTIGWNTSNFLELQKPDTVMPSGPLKLEEATTVMSMTFIGGIVGYLLFPLILKRIGCKRLLLALGIPQVLIWLLIIFAQNPYYLYTSCVISGLIGAGTILCISILVMEISYDNFRGTLTSIRDPSFSLGILFSFVLGNYFDYVTQAKFHLILPVVFLVVFFGLPQTPAHLVKTSSPEAANKAQNFYKGMDLETLPTNETKTPTEKTTVRLSDFTSRRARRAAFIAFSLMILNMLQGFGLLVSYATDVFASTNPDISPHTASALILIVALVAHFIFMHIVDRAGRRTFFIYSAFVSTFGLTLFALHLYFLADNHDFDWFPIVCLASTLFVSCLGMRPVPFIVAIEIFPKNIEQYGYSACILLVMLSEFALTALYPPLKVHIGLVGWVTFFAVMCFCNAIFGIFFIPETKGKSHEEIMKMLDK